MLKKLTLTLCLIAKNEEANIERLLHSVEGCFDEIHLTDTGSTDKTVEIAKANGCHVYPFDWVDDFSAARNASIKYVTTDFWMWLDLDDVLTDKDNFLHFKNHVMNVADFWMATYHYASNEQGAPACSFSRERVFRTEKHFQWKYPVHEGVIPTTSDGEVRVQFIPSWSVTHKRTKEDEAKDKSRNLTILEKNKDALDPRMKYYYGKELFENGRAKEAYATLIDAVAETGLELHDRVLGIQYACYAGLAERDFDRVIALAHQGLQLDPNRAEFHIVIADSYAQTGRLQEALPSYHAAKSCRPIARTSPSALYSHDDAYGFYPAIQITKIHANMGDFETARREAYEALDKFKRPEVQQAVQEIETVRKNTSINFKARATDDIVITCGQSPYEWDADLMKEKAMGGSETAAIQMAYWLRKLSGRPVKIFNGRATPKTCDGVEYMPNGLVFDWMHENRPYVNIAWRHNARVTSAPTYLWCHDLITPGAESYNNYEKILALTPFHKKYLMAMQGVPESKIRVTRNGIDPEKFRLPLTKNPNKILFTSSPDRGLDRAMLVCDIVKETLPDIELHVFYGIEHLDKYGLGDMRGRLKQMMDCRPYVKYHGAVAQDILVSHMREAAVWLYPSDWIETSCITAMEMICAGVYPVVRGIGGVVDTLRDATDKGMCSIVDSECTTEKHRELFALETINAISSRAWKDVHVDADKYSWKSVAEEWLDWL